MKDLYLILGVDSFVSIEVIKKAFRNKALKYHPDRVKDGDKKLAEEQFQEISFAYEILRDNDKRKRYDKYGIINEQEENLDVMESILMKFQTDFSSNEEEEYEEFFETHEHIKVEEEDNRSTLEKLEDFCLGEPDQRYNIRKCWRCKGEKVLEIKKGFFIIKEKCGICEGKGRIRTLKPITPIKPNVNKPFYNNIYGT